MGFTLHGSTVPGMVKFSPYAMLIDEPTKHQNTHSASHILTARIFCMHAMRARDVYVYSLDVERLSLETFNFLEHLGLVSVSS